MRRVLAVVCLAIVTLVVGVVAAPPAAAADLPPGDYLWVTTTTQTLVYDRSKQPQPTLLAQFDDHPTGDPVRVVNQGGAVILVPTQTGIDYFPQRTPQPVYTYKASPNGYQQVVAARGDYAATFPTVYGLRTGGRVIDVFGAGPSLITSITLPGPASYLSAPRPPDEDLIVIGSVKNDNDGRYLSAVIHTSDNSIDYVNPGTRQLVNGAVWSPDGSRAYLSATNLDSSTGSIVTFTPPQGFTTAPMSAGVTPQQVAINPDGSRLYLPAASSSGSSFQVVDTSTLTSVLSAPFDITTGGGAPSYSPDGKVYVPPGPQGLAGSLPFYDIRGALGVLLAGGNSPVVGALVADLPSTIRIESGQNQQAYVDTTFAQPIVVSVVDPAGHPLPDQLVRFTDDDAGARFQGCDICLTYTGQDGKVTSPPIIAEGTAGPAHVLALVEGVSTATIPLTVLPPAVPPTITSLTGGDGQVAVAFTPGDDRGISPPTSFTVTATDVTTPAKGGQTATGSGSPITVTGLTNGDTYTFTVTANTPSGAWTSAPSERLTVGIPSSISGTPPPGEVGRPYRFQFTVTGAPKPTVTLNAGTPLPPGLTFDSATATISGTPTTAGSTFLFFSATNGVGSDQDSSTLMIKPARSLGGAEPTLTESATSPVSAPPGPSSHVATRSAGLASTGMPAGQYVGAGLLLVVLGTAALVLTRRRKHPHTISPDSGR